MIHNKKVAKVAIIIPCFNHGLYLGKCLDSVLSQTFDDWVCVVVNDGSRDDTGVITKQYSQQEPRFQYVKQKNLGLSRARNNGIRACNSEYILPLDADDMIASTYLEKTLVEIENKPDVKLVYTNCDLFGLVDGPFMLPDYSFRLLLMNNLITATALYRRTDYDLTSGYDPKLRAGLEDWDFWLSLLDRDSIVQKVNETLFKYRQREKSMIRSIPKDQSQKIRNYLYYKHIEKYKQFSSDSEVLAYRIRILEKEIRDLRKKDIVGRIKRKVSELGARE